MTRAKDISKIVTDANLSGTLDVTGDLTVDTSTLKVDSTNSRVGVGTASPSRDFQVDSTNNRVAKFHHTDGDYSFIVFEDNNTSDDGQVRLGALGNNCLLYSGGSERMRITSAGNVGIGTSSPNAKLDIKDDSNSVQAILRGRSSDNFGILDFRNNAGDTVKGQIKSDASNRLIFRAGPSNDVMYLNSSGNVGIGTSSPASLLHIKSSTVDARLQLTNSASADDTTNSGASFQLFNDDLYINAVENSGNIIL